MRAPTLAGKTKKTPGLTLDDSSSTRTGDNGEEECRADKPVQRSQTKRTNHSTKKHAESERGSRSRKKKQLRILKPPEGTPDSLSKEAHLKGKEGGGGLKSIILSTGVRDEGKKRGVRRGWIRYPRR